MPLDDQVTHETICPINFYAHRTKSLYRRYLSLENAQGGLDRYRCQKWVLLILKNNQVLKTLVRIKI